MFFGIGAPNSIFHCSGQTWVAMMEFSMWLAGSASHGKNSALRLAGYSSGTFELVFFMAFNACNIVILSINGRWYLTMCLLISC